MAMHHHRRGPLKDPFMQTLLIWQLYTEVSTWSQTRTSFQLVKGVAGLELKVTFNTCSFPTKMHARQIAFFPYYQDARMIEAAGVTSGAVALTNRFFCQKNFS